MTQNYPLKQSITSKSTTVFTVSMYFFVCGGVQMDGILKYDP